MLQSSIRGPSCFLSFINTALDISRVRATKNASAEATMQNGTSAVEKPSEWLVHHLKNNIDHQVELQVLIEYKIGSYDALSPSLRTKWYSLSQLVCVHE